MDKILTNIEGPRSLADMVFKLIENAILDGELKPGEEIPESKLAKLLNTSATPVREAINRLIGDGIVEKIPNKPSRIVILSNKEVEDLFDIRMALERLSISLAADNIDQEGINYLKDLQKSGEEYLQKNNLKKYSQYNHDFHDCLYKYSKNHLIVDMLQNIRKKIMLCTSATTLIPEIPARAVPEHELMIEALIKRDKNNAEKLMIAHIVEAKKELIEKRKK